ncbi:MAG: VTT domain-containing protein, partial [Thermoguttaceae bacterium]
DPAAAALLIVALLSTDVFLPIPSSVLSTLGGETLGFALGTAASFAGLMSGAAIGFGVAKLAGPPLMARLASPEDVAALDRLSRRAGASVLIVTRPVPILAEAAVLFFGSTGLTWARFLAPVALANLVIAAAYSALGAWVHLPAALALSIALPVLAAWIARRIRRA